jgi:hypothetical protein
MRFGSPTISISRPMIIAAITIRWKGLMDSVQKTANAQR